MEYMEISKKVVLDTDVLVDFLRGVRSAIVLVSQLKENGFDIATTVINIFELSWGAYKLGEDRVREIERLVDKLTVLNFKVEHAIRAGEEIAYLESLGLPVDIRDLLIGVISREKGYTIVTGNVKHFTRIRGLKVIHYKSK